MTNLNPLPWVFDQQLPASLHTPLQLSRLTLSLLFRPNIPSPNRTQISKEEPGAAISHLVDCLSSQRSQMVCIGLTLFHHKDVDSPWYRVIAFLPMHSNSRWKPFQTNVYCLHFWNICTDLCRCCWRRFQRNWWKLQIMKSSGLSCNRLITIQARFSCEVSLIFNKQRIVVYFWMTYFYIVSLVDFCWV